MNGAFRDLYNLAFQISPIIFTGGSFSIPTPFIALTGELAAFTQGAATNGQLSLDDFWATFLNDTGATAINNAVATYPFANQSVAANAYVNQPLSFSLTMLIPVRTVGGYLTKAALFTALKYAIDSHVNSGGLFDVLTPSLLYFDCVLLSLTDVTNTAITNQKQVAWQWLFQQPLVSASDANAAFDNQMSKLAGGGVIPT